MNPSSPDVPLVQLDVATTLAPEDQARADFHALLAVLLLQAPNTDLLADLAAAGPLPALRADHPLAIAWDGLVHAAATCDAQAVQDEFAELFVSTGKPAIDPYGSLYLSGFMMEKPLAALRHELGVLGLARRSGVGESEDHLGALCETMRLLIAGAPGLPPRPLATQRSFFIQHLAPWYRRCLEDVRRAEAAQFYRQVADFGLAFLDIEFQAFDIEDAGLATAEEK